MWNATLFGIESYKMILWFLTYSILGWIVESIYMSICNRKLTNRGFAKGPICPIYGVGALTVFVILRPYSHSLLLLFLLGSVLATTLEYITAIIMNKMFGEIWWDYTDKPFNYKGILCLESSIAWGFYTVILFTFLHGFVDGLVNRIPFSVGRTVGTIILALVAVDYTIVMYKQKKESFSKRVLEIKENISFRIRR
ncbi:putative ABC transporter permease [Faecalimonas sp.]